jgi:hypothetical protein
MSDKLEQQDTIFNQMQETNDGRKSLLSVLERSIQHFSAESTAIRVQGHHETSYNKQSLALP